jgi:xylan 1,4-beta-xylosidase
MKNADTYVVRYGIHPEKLYNHYQVDEPSAEVRTLNAGVDYFFRVDAVNANGVTFGKRVKTVD